MKDFKDDIAHSLIVVLYYVAPWKNMFLKCGVRFESTRIGCTEYYVS